MLIDSGSAVTSCPRDRWNISHLSFQAAGEIQAMEHNGEKGVILTTAARRNTRFNFQVCNARFPIVSVFRLTQAGFKLEVSGMTAKLKRLRSGALVWGLIDGTLWLELGTPDSSSTIETR